MKPRRARPLTKLERQGRVLEMAIAGDVHASLWVLGRINVKGALELHDAIEQDKGRTLH